MKENRLNKISQAVYMEKVIKVLYDECVLYPTREIIAREIRADLDQIIGLFEKLELTNVVTVLELYKTDQSFDILDVFPSAPGKVLSPLMHKYRQGDSYRDEIIALLDAMDYVKNTLLPAQRWYMENKLSRIIISIVYLDPASVDALAMTLTLLEGKILTAQQFIRKYCQPYTGELE